MKIKNILGIVYHPILHKMRNSPMLHTVAIRRMVKRSIVAENRKPRLYVDVTNVYKKDTGTGIARVTKEIAARIVKYNQKYDVVCIFNNGFEGYFDATTNNFVTFSKGDIYFGLDNGMYFIKKYHKLYKTLVQTKIPVYFFLHDFIPVRFPNFCKERFIKDYNFFIRRIVNYTSVICNSRATCEDLKKYLNDNPKMKRNKNLFIGYSLLGSDFQGSKNTKQAKEHSSEKITFLMVSTVEPRKKYDQAVRAFDILWKKGIDVSLTIVGRKGWKAQDTFDLIENNAEYCKRLLWYNTGISDGELAALYEKSSAVIMASVTEGFGLAVAEAAQFQKPLIIRDIPVFREIAGDNAFYFTGFESEDLANKIEEWISLYKKDKSLIPDTSKIHLRTWDDCTKDVYDILTGASNREIGENIGEKE